MRRLIALVGKFVRLALLPILIVALTDFVVDYANPFGIGTVIETAVGRLIQREAAALPSGCKGGSCDSPGQASVTVVLINRQFVSDVMKTDEPVWPLPASTLMQRVIKPILRERPAAVFIDLAFPNAPRELAPGVYVTNTPDGPITGADFLAEQFAALDQDSTTPPIFLSDVIAPTSEDAARRGHCDIAYVPEDALAAHSVMSRKLRANIFGGRSDGRVTLVDSAVLNAEGAYQLAPVAAGPAGSCGERARRDDAYIPSPALALLKAYCPDQPTGDLMRRAVCRKPVVDEMAAQVSPGAARDALGFRRYALTHELADRSVMELRWRTNLTQTTQAGFADAPGVDVCRKQFHRSLFEPLIIYAVTLFKPLERLFAEQLERPCLAIDTITPADLGALFPSDGGAGLKDRRFGQAFVRDRIVLIGVDLTQAGDKFDSPVSGVIPGVYVHATAIENLLNRGRLFAPAEVGARAGALLFLAAALAVFVLRWLWKLMLRVAEKTWPPVGELLFAPLVYLVAALPVSLGFLALFDHVLPSIGLVLPLTKIALPIIAVHLVVFAEWGERLKTALVRAIVPTEKTPAD